MFKKIVKSCHILYFTG